VIHPNKAAFERLCCFWGLLISFDAYKTLWRGGLPPFGCAVVARLKDAYRQEKLRRFVRGLLRSPTGASPLATGNPFTPEHRNLVVFCLALA
jgi:hypothetical protein